ncbi:MAG TPA: prepilin-type N-terminal cleavage/methylation domain-containing protein [Candidatus Polarisedimenticolaceae bacterium]|nr:prepilin-type N-terminal cleavage/methylation domain-containing protein [Candidatus Polarisedimenticolaceae bacterium]
MRQRNRQAGFSMAEMLIVIAFIGIAVAIGIPLVNEQVRIAEVRSSADDLALHLRAARMIAVAKHKTIVFTVNVDPANSFSYTTTDNSAIFTGSDPKVRGPFFMPKRVKIAAGSDGQINFFQNGAVDFSSSIILESQVSDSLERWTATVNTIGLTTLAHQRI